MYSHCRNCNRTTICVTIAVATCEQTVCESECQMSISILLLSLCCAYAEKNIHVDGEKVGRGYVLILFHMDKF